MQLHSLISSPGDLVPFLSSWPPHCKHFFLYIYICRVRNEPNQMKGSSSFASPLHSVHLYFYCSVRTPSIILVICSFTAVRMATWPLCRVLFGSESPHVVRLFDMPLWEKGCPVFKRGIAWHEGSL